MNLFLALHPDSKALFKQLDELAATGDYNVEALHRIKASAGIYRCRETVYYLASLYIKCSEFITAHELLSVFNTASPSMKRYFHVMLYSKHHGLALPRLSKGEQQCLGFLDAVLNPVDASFESAILNAGGFSVVGNAPGGLLSDKLVGTRVYFNSYQSNDRITDNASVHVVTPSWNKNLTVGSDVICITGNDSFYRRSLVWRKFIGDESKKAIYTVPAHLWGSLYKELGGSPSAGILMLAWLEAVAARNAGVLTGYIAGFSNGQPLVNHSYDSVPASTRHNWGAEHRIRDRLLASLEHSCLSLSVEL